MFKYFSEEKGRDAFIHSQNSRNLFMARWLDLRYIVRNDMVLIKIKKGTNRCLNLNGNANRKKIVLKRVY